MPLTGDLVLLIAQATPFAPRVLIECLADEEGQEDVPLLQHSEVKQEQEHEQETSAAEVRLAMDWGLVADCMGLE